MNRDDLRRALKGILDSLNGARSRLEGAAAWARRVVGEQEAEESPFNKDYLDEELCMTIEKLSDDVDNVAEDVEWMLGDLDEGGAGRGGRD